MQATATHFADTTLPLGAAAVGMPALQQFRALMAAEGHAVQVARLCFDRLYAYERIALAHAGSDAALRALALRLFQACHNGTHNGTMSEATAH